MTASGEHKTVQARILKIAPFGAMGTPVELLKEFGGRTGFEKAVHELQSALYAVYDRAA